MFLGCGYHFVGSNPFAGNIQSVCIHILNNRSGSTGFENQLTHDLMNEFIRNSRIKLTCNEAVDADITGQIHSIHSKTSTHDASYIASERTVFVSVDLELILSDGTILRSIHELSDHENYLVHADKMTTEVNQHKALSKLSKRMAEHLFLLLSHP
ncbi:MAG: hypothetical protein HQK77_15445 [Desulfobacterales bacterium]|nr:hypothetical protein [Desulfobacterales bacterium]